MKRSTPYYVLTIVFILMTVSTYVFAHGDHRPKPPKQPRPFPEHDHPNLQQQIEELFNLDRLQQSLLDDEIRQNDRQRLQISRNMRLIQANNGLINQGLQELMDLSGRVDTLESAALAFDERLNSLESHMRSAEGQFTKAIAAASALDAQAPTLSGTRLTFNIGQYGGYTAIGVGITTRFHARGEPSLGFAVATVGGETVGRAQFGFSFERPNR